MTSSETSRADSGPLKAVRFPPRTELPPDVVIERLPALGTSWYERGASYWARRIVAIPTLLIGVAIYVAIISGVIHAAGPPGSPGFIAVLTAETIFSLGTAFLLIRNSLRQAASGRLASTSSNRRGRTGAGLGILVYSAGGAVGAFLIAVSALLSAGFMLAVLILWLLPVLPTEQQARQRLAETLRVRYNTRPGHGPAGHHHHSG